MAKILVVEDGKNWIDIYQRSLAEIVGEENFYLVKDYDSATKLLDKGVYDAYVLDGEFPNKPGMDPKPLGIQLAKEISQKVDGYDKIRIASGNPSILDEAKELGIKGLYSKGLPNEKKGQKSFFQLEDDIKQDLGL